MSDACFPRRRPGSPRGAARGRPKGKPRCFGGAVAVWNARAPFVSCARAMRCGQIVVGPAGTGKSTYCATMEEHCLASRRSVYLVNLDPAAELFNYNVGLDVRDLISVGEVMEDLGLGPNGALIYCMEYLLDNIDWLVQGLEGFGEEDYIFFDCPGQLELYSHVPVMKRLVRALQEQCSMRLCAVYLLDATFAVDAPKFLAGSLNSLSAMVQLALPHLNVITKCDLIDPENLEKLLDLESARAVAELGGQRVEALTSAITQVLDDFSLVSYLPLNPNDEDTIGNVLAFADHLVQFGEDLEPKHPDEDGAPGS